MKKRVLFFAGMLVAASFTACNNAADKVAENEVEENAISADMVDNAGTAKFTFEEEQFDFGTINEGDVVEHEFTFTNSGDAPLIITSANGSCGCTVPNPPKEPIAPGASASIKVSFNSQGKPGNQQKTVTINANTEPTTTILRISAQVTPKEAPEAAPAQG
jgi:hypothetical protein